MARRWFQLADKAYDAFQAHKKFRRAKKLGKQFKRLFELLEKVERRHLMSALKSKTVWFGIVTEIWGVAQVLLGGGDFSREAIVSLVTGALIIILRAVTTTPLASK